MIEKYVISLELAKKMNELGWKKETQFHWYKIPNSDRWVIQYYHSPKGEILNAPLFAEIWEELPCGIILEKSGIGNALRVIWQRIKKNFFSYNNPTKSAGELWCWCVENGYIDVNKS